MYLISAEADNDGLTGERRIDDENIGVAPFDLLERADETIGSFNDERRFTLKEVVDFVDERTSSFSSSHM